MKKSNGKSADTDVIIIGGGPSGSAAAIWAGLNNLRVIIIESHKFPRHKPGETLHPGLEVIFKQLGVFDEISKLNPLRHTGILLKNQNHTIISEYGEDVRGKWKGFQILREDLDSILLNKLKSLNNVRLLQPCKAIRILKNNGEIIGLETSKGVFNAKFLIDASGSRKWLSRQLNLKNTIFSKPLFAKYGYQKKSNIDSELPIFEFVENGWIWRAKISDNLFHWTHLFIDTKPKREEITQNTNTKLKAADVTWKFNFECAASRYFICGDSCATLDPSASKGVLRAMYSGVLASDTIVKIINKKVDEATAYISYKKLMEKWFMNDKNNMEAFYKESGLDIGFV